jgi:hypothetical protein
VLKKAIYLFKDRKNFKLSVGKNDLDQPGKKYSRQGRLTGYYN